MDDLDILSDDIDYTKPLGYVTNIIDEESNIVAMMPLCRCKDPIDTGFNVCQRCGQLIKKPEIKDE